MAADLLRALDVSLAYETPEGSFTAVDGVSLTVREGERFVLFGPSGCGKSGAIKRTVFEAPCLVGIVSTRRLYRRLLLQAEKRCDRRDEFRRLLQGRAVTAGRHLDQLRSWNAGGELASENGRSSSVERADHYQGRVPDVRKLGAQIELREGAAGRGEVCRIGP